MRTRPIGKARRTSGARTWAAALAACAVLGALVFPANAPAARGLTTGLTAVDQYQSNDPAVRNLWFNRTVDAGAGIVRLSLHWRSVAATPRANPTSPTSYGSGFSLIDAAVRDAAARGLQILLTVNTAPDWAEGPGRSSNLPLPGSWRPNPTALAQFMQAVATRYSGSFDPDGPGGQPRLPLVQALQVWNEPNQDTWLAPQFQGKEIIGPDQYRELLNASYPAIKAASPQTLVVTGGTSPYGDNPGGPYPPGGPRVRPVQWWEDFLCVRTAKTKKKKGKKGKKQRQTRYVRSANCGGRPVFDVLAHQAIDNTGKGPLQSGPSKFDVSTPDLGRVTNILRSAERLGTISGRHPVWVTEFWWDSNPPNPVGAPLLTQARWIEQTLYLFWKAGADTAINFQIRDSSEYPNTHNGFQSGLYFLDGSTKTAALTAFRFPFVTERLNTKRVRAWGKAPESGQLQIQRQRGARFVTLKKLQIGKGQVFKTKLRLKGKGQLRATVGNSTSLVWTQAAGAKRKRKAR
jgi:hypothetical protein